MSGVIDAMAREPSDAEPPGSPLARAGGNVIVVHTAAEWDEHLSKAANANTVVSAVPAADPAGGGAGRRAPANRAPHLPHAGGGGLLGDLVRPLPDDQPVL